MVTIAKITVDSVPDNPSVKVVNVSGEIDESNLLDFEQVVNPLVSDLNNKVLIFNLNSLKFISSKVIGQFASIYTTLTHSQRQLTLTNLNQDIIDIFTLVGLNQMIPEYPNLEDALVRFTNKPETQ